VGVGADLRAAKAAHAAVIHGASSPAGASSSTSNDVSDSTSEAVHQLESAYTHTLFYYAQIYASLGRREAAAKYIERTLTRQAAAVEAARAAAAASGSTSGTPATATPSAEEEDEKAAEADPFTGMTPIGMPSHTPASPASSGVDRLEWARNALRLTQLFVNKRLWAHAACCIAAAEVMLAWMVQEKLGTSPTVSPGGTSSTAPSSNGPSTTLAHVEPAAAFDTTSLPDNLQVPRISHKPPVLRNL
jgi:hypothetical protein